MLSDLLKIFKAVFNSVYELKDKLRDSSDEFTWDFVGLFSKNQENSGSERQFIKKNVSMLNPSEQVLFSKSHIILMLRDGVR